MLEASSEIEVFAPAEVVYAVLWDVARYPDFLSDVADASVEPTNAPDGKPGDDARTLEAVLDVVLVRPRRCRVKLLGRPPYRIDWTLLEGELQAVNDGSWLLESHPSGRSCLVRYEVRLQLTVAVPEAIVKKLVAFNLPTLLRQIKARAEHRHRQVAGP